MQLCVLQRTLKLCLLSFLTAFLTGCMTTLPIQKLPTTSEAFKTPPDQLRAEYPEITQYETKFMGFTGTTNQPYVKQLVSTWGEPDQKKTDWVYPVTMGATLVGCGFFFGPVPALITAGLVFAIRPYPFEYYYWRKDDYCIEAKLDSSIVNAYNASMIYWKWHHKSDGKDIPVECNKQVTATVLTEKNK